MKKYLSLLSALVMLLVSSLGVIPSYAAATVSDGVVAVESKTADMKRYVYYPEELNNNSKKYPVIVWANGTGCQPSLYESLLKGFAREGYIIVFSDETMAADGTDQIAGLDFIIDKSKKSSDPLYKRVDTTKVTAMGHSQGGRSAVNAAAADKRFCCVVSLAGSNYDYEAKLLKAPTFFVTGTNDGMVSSSKWVKPAYDICQGAAAYASLKGARHTACCNEPEKYIDYCVSWIKAWTNNDTASLNVFKAGGALENDSDWTDVTRKDLTNNKQGKIILSTAAYTYNGKVRKPGVTVKDYRGATINSDNYTVTYASGRKNVGKYKVTVKYRKNYTGSKSVYFTIAPKGTGISKLTAGSKKLTVKLKKQTTQTSGYQIQYSTSSKFSSAKSVTVGNKTTSKTITGLKADKKYYVRVRTYKTVNGTKFYSAWSKSQNTTTKR